MSDVLASYKVNGLMRLAIEDFEQPDIRLDYFDNDPGYNTYNGFDRFGRVSQQLWRDYGASADADKVAYSYDRDSNRKYRENLLSSAKSELYAYDSLDRLVNFQRGTLDTNKTGIDGTPADEEQFTLDAVGNWAGYLTKVGGTEDANQSRGHNKANEVTSISGTPGWSAPGYDAAGNVKAFHASETPDLLAYDAWNRLARYQYSGEDDQADYEYDGLNRRVRKSFDGWYNDYYYNISWQLLEVRKDGAAGALEQYVWSLRYIDSPVLRDRDADGNAGTGGLGAAASGMEQRVYYLTDGNFNVTALAGTDGAILERYAYDAYGKARFYDPNWSPRIYGSSYGNAILFCGYFRDAETGMYHVRHRYYHPQLGRWMSRDPIGYVDGMGLYEYVGGCPTGWTDFLGLLKVFIWNTTSYSTGHWGHVSILLDDGKTYISYWPMSSDSGRRKSSCNGWWFWSPPETPEKLGDDIANMERQPDKTMKVCGLDEKAIKDWWDEIQKRAQDDKPIWSSVTNNCCHMAYKAFVIGGAVKWPILGVWSPARIEEYVEQHVLAEDPMDRLYESNFYP